PPPGAPSEAGDPADPPGAYRTPEIPWYVWAGLACVGLAMPIGGLAAVRRQRRRAATRAHEVRTT
ncbi:MAG: hypothetical protein H0W96_08730, partial [Solirubrobacterales bacterium]|nr:hypothetical protein [Solirubrobacterales bacterium]